ncbi:hypothetical protein ACFL44_02530 [Gemmatimonadota bacterium]
MSIRRLPPPDFLTPKSKFEDALELDPNNHDASLGLALCEIGLLSQDATLAAAIGGIITVVPFGKAVPGASAPGLLRGLGDIEDQDSDLLTPGGWLTWMQGRMGKIMQSDPMLDLEPLQSAIETIILPVVDTVILLLNAVESDVTWTLVLTPQMQGFQNLDGQLEIDVTDIYLVDGAMQTLKAMLNFFVSYNLNIPDLASETEVVAAFNQTDGTFLSLRTNGATHMGNTRLALMAAIAKMNQFSTSLEAEIDDQTDDLIKLGDDGPSEEQLAEIEAGLVDLILALNGDRVITEDFDEDGVDDVLTVNLSSIFTSPVQNLKHLMPPYSWESEGQVFLWNGYLARDLSQWVFPDPTMGGIFPDFTTDAELKAFFHIPTDTWVSPGPFFFGGEVPGR